MKLVMILALGDSSISGWAGQLCSASPALDSDLRSDKGAKVTPDMENKGMKGFKWLDLAENHQALLSSILLNLTGEEEGIPFPSLALF